MYSVYALVDPRDKQVRYVGISKNAWRRYAMHLLLSPKGTTAKNNWIEELRKIDLSPLLTILESAETEEDALNREAYWIQYYLNLNIPLLNMAKTGVVLPHRPTKLSPVPGIEGGFITVEEIAQASEVSVDTVHRLIKQKKLVAHKIGGNWRIAYDDFQKYLEATRNK